VNAAQLEYAPPGTVIPVRCGPNVEDYALGIDGVMAVIIDDEGYGYEVMYADSDPEFVTNYATQGPAVVLDWEDEQEPRTIAILRHERELYADCFGSVPN